MDIDTKIKEMFDVVKTQRTLVAKAEVETKRGWKTNCSFRIDDKSPVNVTTAQTNTIVDMLTTLLAKQHYIQEAHKILGLDNKIEVNGYSTEEWVEDFKKRVEIIKLREKKERLESLEARLNQIISPEQRRELEMQSIIDEMKRFEI